jgi:GNAT superfamily N-acetyltransferase
MARPGKISVRPVTPETWDDMARLFSARGAPHYCWCGPYRYARAHEMSADAKRVALRELVSGGTPVGVLAYDAGVPVGWCSIAPRESYVKLGRSRSMPRRTPPATSTWTVLCFFVPRSHRRRGVPAALLRGGVDYAAAQGAAVIEGYPYDTAGISSTHRGHSSVFRAAGFRREAGRWVVKPAASGN